MTHNQVKPESACDGFLKPDRYRLQRRELTRKWRCVKCRKRLWRSDLSPASEPRDDGLAFHVEQG